MFTRVASALAVQVALRKESVDRNSGGSQQKAEQPLSLSARRAWIEIAGWPCPAGPVPVALRKESVDRNKFTLIEALNEEGRSPQGERG